MILVNRLLGLALGLALLTGGALIVGEVLLAITEQRPWVIDRTALDQQLSQLTWSDPRVLPTALALLAVGILLLLLQLIPRRPSTLPLASTEHRRSRIERRGVESRLRAVASADDDVLTAKARVGKRTVKVTARAEYGSELPAVQDRVRDAVAGELSRLGLDLALKSNVTQARPPR